MILGSEKKSIIKMIMTEYGIICLISYFAGCIAGMLFLFIIVRIIISEGIPISFTYQLLIRNALITLGYVLAIFVTAIVLNTINLYRYSLASLLSYKEKKTKIPSVKFGITGTILGILAIIAATGLLLKQPIDYKRMKYGIILGLAGTYLCFTYLGSLILSFLNKKEQWYYAHLLKIKNLFYRFSENKNIILLVFLINFFVYIFVILNIVEFGNTSSQYLWKYPYDLVWMVEQKHVNEIDRVTKPISQETKICPYTIISSNEGGKYVGIPVSSYNEFATDKETLKSGELLAVLQKGELDEEIMFERNQVYLQWKDEWKLFNIKKEIKEVPFIAQQAENIFILVLNNRDYQSLNENIKSEDMVIVAQNFKKESTAIEKDLQTMAQKWNATVYFKNELMLQDRKEDILSLIFYINMGIFLIISNLTILAIKTWAEVPLLIHKYGFLRKIGMDMEDMRTNIKSELSLCLKIPFYLSGIIGSILLAGITNGIENGLRLQVMILFVALILLQFIYIIAMKNYGYRLIVNRIKN